jgi:hypothetical protein
VSALTQLGLSTTLAQQVIPKKSLFRAMNKRHHELWIMGRLAAKKVKHSKFQSYKQNLIPGVYCWKTPHYLRLEIRPSIFVAQLMLTYRGPNDYPLCPYCSASTGLLANPKHIFMECGALSSFFGQARSWCQAQFKCLAVSAVVSACNGYHDAVLRGIDHLISSLPHEHPFVKYLPVAV